MIEDLFWCLMIYLLYRFVFQFIIPIAKTVSKMKKTVSQMKGDNQEYQQTQQNQKATNSNTNDEYIDFEEVK